MGLIQKMDPRDRETFYFDLADLQWTEFIFDYVKVLNSLELGTWGIF